MSKDVLELMFVNETETSRKAYHFKKDEKYYTIIVDKNNDIDYLYEQDIEIQDFKKYLNNLYPLFELKEPDDADKNMFNTYADRIIEDINDNSLSSYDLFYNGRFINPKYSCKQCGSIYVKDVVYGKDKTGDFLKGRYMWLGDTIPRRPFKYACIDCGYLGK